MLSNVDCHRALHEIYDSQLKVFLVSHFISREYLCIDVANIFFKMFDMIMHPFEISLYIGIIFQIDTIYGHEYDCKCGEIFGLTNPRVGFYNDTANFDDGYQYHDDYRTGFCNGVRLSRYHVLTAKSCFDLSNLACE